VVPRADTHGMSQNLDAYLIVITTIAALSLSSSLSWPLCPIPQLGLHLWSVLCVLVLRDQHGDMSDTKKEHTANKASPDLTWACFFAHPRDTHFFFIPFLLLQRKTPVLSHRSSR
jgi:hypothetical protein